MKKSGILIIATVLLFSIALIFPLGSLAAELLAPKDFTVESPTQETVLFSWSEVKDASGYNIYLKEGSGNFVKINETPVPETSYEYALPQKTATWQACVAAVAADGTESICSSPVLFKKNIHAATDSESSDVSSDASTDQPPAVTAPVTDSQASASTGTSASAENPFAGFPWGIVLLCGAGIATVSLVFVFFNARPKTEE